MTITLGGAASKTTATDSSGNYSFTGLANGSYTVTPSLTAYSFSPASSTVSVSSANVTGKNFTATALGGASTYSISGSTGVAGTAITLSGDNTGSTLTDTSGNYSFSGLLAGSYTVAPTQTGYTFSPTSAPVTITASSVTGTDFVATAVAVPHNLTGTVTLNGAALPGVTISVTGPATATTTTDSSGNYSVSLYSGTYTVTPSKSGYTFNPNSSSVTMGSSADSTGHNFAATSNAAVTATVTGSVSGPWPEGVSVSVSGGGASGTTTTNASGNYSFTLASGQAYTFTATLSGYNFTTGSATITAGSSTAVTASGITETSAVSSNSISGTLTYAGSQKGGITVRVFYSTCTSYASCQVLASIHLPKQSGGAFTNLPYTIRGLQFNGGNYVVKAGIGVQNTGYPNASNPGGSVTLTNPTQGTDVTTGADITITDNTPPAPGTMSAFNVAPGDGGAIVVYDPNLNGNGAEIATSYLLSWGTDAAASNGGSHMFKAQGANRTVFLIGDPNAIEADGTTVASTALTNGTSYYFSLTPYVGTTAGTAYVTPGTYKIGPVAGGDTVTGKVNYTGTATGPMYIVVHNQGGNGSFSAYGQVIASPTSGSAYSVTGVPTGTWQVTAIVDQNHDGEIDTGDIANTNSNASFAASPGSNTQNVTLLTANATVTIATDHQYDTVNSTNNYSENQFLNDGMKRLVGVTLFSGPNVAVPADLSDGNGWGQFNNYDWIGSKVPSMSDVYQFQVTYSDGTSETLSGSPTAVLGASAMATNLQVTNPTTPTPTFTWTPASSQPTGCLTYLNVNNWYYPSGGNGLACSTNSVNYNADNNAAPLGTSTGIKYSWSVINQDANLNTASAIGYFTN